MLNRRHFRRRAYDLSDSEQLDLKKFDAMLSDYQALVAKVLPKQEAIKMELKKLEGVLEGLAFPTEADKALVDEIKAKKEEILNISARLEQLDYNVKASKTGASKIVKRAYEIVSLEIKPKTFRTEARKIEDIYAMLDKVSDKLKELGMTADDELESYMKELRDMVIKSVDVSASVKEKITKGTGTARVQEELSKLEDALSRGKDINSSMMSRRLVAHRLDSLYMGRAINDRQYTAFQRCARRNATRTLQALRHIRRGGIFDSVRELFSDIFDGIVSFGKSIFGFFRSFSKGLESVNDDLADISSMLG